MTTTSRAGRAASRADRSDAVDWAARAGLLAYGVVHLVIAWLAVQLALGDREGSPNQKGAVRELAEQPFGQVLVWAVAVGLLLLVLWQGLEAALGHRDDDGFTRTRKRVGSAGRAVVYLALGVSTLQVATGSGSSGGGGTDSTTAKLLGLPGGQLLVGLVGAGVLAVGGYLVWKGVSDRFLRDLEHSGRSGSTGTAYTWLGRVGHVAKGVALGIVGVLFGWAAATHDPEKSGGLDQALREVLDQPFGPVLLIVTALGIGAYGLFCFAWSRHLDR
ncbi:DUF1206 domain-containing protein [Nocardioides sp. SYSU D00038]|uniref:DUF1206 domain-containing protein n=1 Tax=Nocardioides sp. SYSU D00038 TaxID=2812554 RepID=UPI001967627D|nr:DUF1206 domain-containing protein [Nocardioides sp. SYSU D00038]